MFNVDFIFKFVVQREAKNKLKSVTNILELRDRKLQHIKSVLRDVNVELEEVAAHNSETRTAS